MKYIPDFSLFSEINDCIKNGGTLQIKPKNSDFWFDVITPSFSGSVHFTVKSDSAPERKVIELHEIDQVRRTK